MTATFEVLDRELAEARERLADLERARRELEQRLRDARVAEETARRGVEALEMVAREAPGGRAPLAGAALRQQLTRSALRRRPGEPAHWRRWLDWLREDSFDAAGRNPEATFVTQLIRSPLVRRADREGVYVLDVSLAASLRERLQCLHERLRGMPPPDQLALLGDDDRAARQDLQLEIGRAERAMREAWTVLSEERAPWLAPDAPASAEAWLREPADTAQLIFRPSG